MRISLVQQGLIVQQEFAKLLMMGSGGRIELAPPLTDDERRDFEIHVRGQFGFGLAIQVKSTMRVQRKDRLARILHCFFQVPARRLVTSPLFFYFLAYLDPKLMRLADPVFLIPSRIFHEYASPRLHGPNWQFTFMGSLETTSNDRWRPFHVNTLELGQKVLEIMGDLRRRHLGARQSATILSVPDLLWVQAVGSRDTRSRTRKRAA
jgi:hypothetical protein